jgi:hypothetical protein
MTAASCTAPPQLACRCRCCWCAGTIRPTADVLGATSASAPGTTASCCTRPAWKPSSVTAMPPLLVACRLLELVDVLLTRWLSCSTARTSVCTLPPANTAGRCASSCTAPGSSAVCRAQRVLLLRGCCCAPPASLCEPACSTCTAPAALPTATSW